MLLLDKRILRRKNRSPKLNVKKPTPYTPTNTYQLNTTFYKYYILTLYSYYV